MSCYAFAVRGTLNSARYCNEILDAQVAPWFRRMRRQHRATRDDLIFQQDGATCHTARATMAHLQQLNIPVLPWPSKSPDLSPIENCWDRLGVKVSERVTENSTLADLERFLIEEWNALTPQYITNLMHSMRHRIEECISVQGGSTSY